MYVIETLNEGLKREIKIVIPAEDLETRLKERLINAKNKIRLNGFRPGKVPDVHLRKVYGKSLMADVINSLLSETPTAILSERGEIPATLPEIKMMEEKAVRVFNGKEDLVFSLEYEVLPQILLKDISTLEVTRETAEVPESQVDEQIKHALSSTRTYTEKEDEAQENDRVILDYSGKLIDGSTFDGGSARDTALVLGSGAFFVPGFEDQLIGSKKGNKKKIFLTFPKNYRAAHLAGKEAVFEVTVKTVSGVDSLEINDEAVKKLGLSSLEQLRKIVREQIENQYRTVSRQKLKRQIFDALDIDHPFVAPECLIQKEFDIIWNQITTELKKDGRSFEDEKITEEQARNKYRKFAERRVRLELLLFEIGKKAEVTITEEELKRAIYAQTNHYPGHEKEIFDFFLRTPAALNSVRAKIFEEKVVNHLLEQIKILDRTISPEELLEDNPSEEENFW